MLPLINIRNVPAKRKAEQDASSEEHTSPNSIGPHQPYLLLTPDSFVVTNRGVAEKIPLFAGKSQLKPKSCFYDLSCSPDGMIISTRAVQTMVNYASKERLSKRLSTHWLREVSQLADFTNYERLQREVFIYPLRQSLWSIKQYSTEFRNFIHKSPVSIDFLILMQKKYAQLAQALHQHGFPEQAQRKQIKADIFQAHILFHSGKQMLQANNVSRAIYHFCQAIKKKNDEPMFYDTLIPLLHRKEGFSRHLKIHLDQAIPVSPHPLHHYYLGLWYQRHQDVGLAKHHLLSAYLANRTHLPYVEALGAINVHLGDFPSAFRAFSQASYLSPRSSSYPFLAGECLMQQENYTSAIDWLHKALQIEPYNIKFLSRIIDCFHLHQQQKEELAFLTKLARLAPMSKAYLTRWARMMDRSNNLLEGIHAYQKLLHLYPQNSFQFRMDFCSMLLRCQQSGVQPNDVPILASEQMQKIWQMELSDPEQLLQASELAIQLQPDCPQAERALRKVILQQPQQAQAHWMLGQVLLQQQRPADAATYLNNALQMGYKPQVPPTL